MTITPAQCRAARGLLDWRQHELAAAASVGLSTVRDLETSRRDVSADKLVAIRAAIEAAGVELLSGSGERIGVRLRAGVSEPDPRDQRRKHGNIGNRSAAKQARPVERRRAKR